MRNPSICCNVREEVKGAGRFFYKVSTSFGMRPLIPKVDISDGWHFQTKPTRQLTNLLPLPNHIGALLFGGGVDLPTLGEPKTRQRNLKSIQFVPEYRILAMAKRLEILAGSHY